MSALAPLLILLLLSLPVLAGVAMAVLAAFGWQPGDDAGVLSLQPWQALFTTPGIARSVFLSISTGVLATSLTLVLALLLAGSLQARGTPGYLRAWLPPLLALPHAAVAFGLLFLLAPSGWLVRWLSPWLTGWNQAPDLLLTQDPAGLALVLGLVVKEMPFLLLMVLVAHAQVDAPRNTQLARSLGYAPLAAWSKVVLPRIYPLIRLPVYAVLAYSVSVVDVAMILGPSTPAPLAVRLLGWLADPDPALRLKGAAAAVLQMALVIVVIGAWRGIEFAVAAVGRAWLLTGKRKVAEQLWPLGANFATALLVLLLVPAVAAQLLWSVAGLWVFPDSLPQQFTLQTWQASGAVLRETTGNTLLLAFPALGLALLLALACLEAETRHGRTLGSGGLWLLYLPLLIPQAGFLPGLQLLFLRMGLDGSLCAVLLAHVVFVFPYVLLTLIDPYRRWDIRYAQVAATLGANHARMLLRVRLPMLLAPLLTAAAIGFAVSVGQYLPTLLIGGGRINTLTTEALALAVGGDRRQIAVQVLLQMALPLCMYALALGLPLLLFARRKGMRGEP